MGKIKLAVIDDSDEYLEIKKIIIQLIVKMKPKNKFIEKRIPT